MTCNEGSALLFILVLVGASLGAVVTQQLDSIDPVFPDSDLACESSCQACKATGKIINGACKCFSDNGGEVVCLPKARIKRELSPTPEGQMGKDVVRGHRCLGLLGSARSTLQNVLGQGLFNMTTAERLAEFRKRIESLRSLAILGAQRTNLTSDPATEISAATKTSLPVSPFLGKPLGDSIPTTDGTETAKNDPPSQPEEAELGTVLTDNVIPEKLGVQEPSPQSVNSIPTPAEGLNNDIKEPKSSLTTKDNTGIANVGKEGRVLRSPTIPIFQSPFLSNLVAPAPHAASNPAVSNPLASTLHDAQRILSAMTQGHVIPALPINPRNKRSTSDSSADSQMNRPENPSNSQVYPPGMIQSVKRVTNGDMKAVGGILDSVGVGREVGSFVEGIIASPQSGLPAQQFIPGLAL